MNDEYRKYDFICGGNCWYLKPEIANLFTLAVTNARRIANADQERVESVKLAKAAKRKPAKPRKSPAKKRLPTEPVGEIEGGC